MMTTILLSLRMLQRSRPLSTLPSRGRRKKKREEEEDDEEATVEVEGQEEFELDAEGQESDADTEPYDDEEFEGYEDKIDAGSPSKNKDPITIVDVPAHLQNSWESYYMEILMVTGLLAYIMNYIIGKNKNSRLAHAWFNSHRELLESNFSLVGEFTCGA
ncbi:unnamed protein product [Staurois parvus]|uniref:PAT complex subunit CCDC47 n=1 Tax=Staurois parvus TaxID=386267 RepID=A0ABN9AQG8_9NEOB|nr:unnamed protein product [Staurois parvus]